jgi:hypothetical protein
MEKKKKSTRPYKQPEKVIEERVEIQPIKPKLVKERYILIRDYHVGGKLMKKGTPIYLTKEGKKYLQNNFYI